MDIQDLRVFTRVAAVQNLSSVGQEFSLTPGTISKRLQALEDELGVRLFVRSTRSIRITEEGRILLGHAQRMLEEFDTAKASVDGNIASPRGLLKVIAPRRLGGHDVGKLLSAFLVSYPEIEVQAELCDSAHALHEDGFDITLRTGELTDSSLIAKRLADDPMIIVASPDYLKQKGSPVAPQDLDKHSCLIQGDTCHWPFKRRSQEKSVRINGRLRCNDFQTLHAAALDGHGLLRASAACVKDDIQKGLLVPVLTDFDTTGGSAIWAVFPKSRNMLPRLRVLIDFFGERLKGSTGNVKTGAVERVNGSLRSLGRENGLHKAMHVNGSGPSSEVEVPPKKKPKQNGKGDKAGLSRSRLV